MYTPTNEAGRLVSIEFEHSEVGLLRQLRLTDLQSQAGLKTLPPAAKRWRCAMLACTKALQWPLLGSSSGSRVGARARPGPACAAQVLWPWSGHLALYIRILPEGEQFTGQATGEVTFSIVSPGLRGESDARRSHVRLPLRLDILPTPPRCAPNGTHICCTRHAAAALGPG